MEIDIDILVQLIENAYEICNRADADLHDAEKELILTRILIASQIIPQSKLIAIEEKVASLQQYSQTLQSVLFNL